jgi:hypothetical protein
MKFPCRSGCGYLLFHGSSIYKAELKYIMSTNRSGKIAGQKIEICKCDLLLLLIFSIVFVTLCSQRNARYAANKKRVWICGSVCISFVLTSLDSPFLPACSSLSLAGRGFGLESRCAVPLSCNWETPNDQHTYPNSQISEEHVRENRRRQCGAFKWLHDSVAIIRRSGTT